MPWEMVELCEFETKFKAQYLDWHTGDTNSESKHFLMIPFDDLNKCIIQMYSKLKVFKNHLQ